MSAYFYSLTCILAMASIGIDPCAERDLIDLAARISLEENQ